MASSTSPPVPAAAGVEDPRGALVRAEVGVHERRRPRRSPPPCRARPAARRSRRRPARPRRAPRARDRATTTATASPAKCDVVDRHRRVPRVPSCPAVIGHALGSLTPARRRGPQPVKTPMTPGAPRAADVSMPVIRACAMGLRTKAECSMPGSTMLSVHRVRPVISRWSSLRTRALPTSGLVDGGHGPLQRSRQSRRGRPVHPRRRALTARTMFW